MVDEQEEAKQQNDARKESGKIVPLQKGRKWIWRLANIAANLWVAWVFLKWLASLL